MKSTDAQNVSQQRQTNVQDIENSFVVFYRVERGLFQKLSGGGEPLFLRGGPKPYRTDHRGSQDRGRPPDSRAMLSL